MVLMRVTSSMCFSLSRGNTRLAARSGCVKCCGAVSEHQAASAGPGPVCASSLFLLQLDGGLVKCCWLHSALLVFVTGPAVACHAFASNCKALQHYAMTIA